MDASHPGEDLPNTLETAYTSDPLLYWNLLRLSLECGPTPVVTCDSSCAKNTSALTRSACLAGASLISVLNREHRLQLIGECQRWLVDGQPDVQTLLFRVQSLFVIIERQVIFFLLSGFQFIFIYSFTLI